MDSKDIRKKIDLTLASFLKDVKKSSTLDKIAPQLYFNLEEFLLRKAKRIRPTLFILAYIAYKKNYSLKDANLFRCAISLELLHDFFLIHDDIIDNSNLRRGKATLHKILEKSLKSQNRHLGPNLAIVCGDVVFALAIKAFLNIKEKPRLKEKALEKFCEAAFDTGVGEFIDVMAGTKKIEEITEKEIFLNYTLKTSRYTFECPLVMGALLGGASQKDLRNLSSSAVYIGQAFQIQDDLLGLFGTEEKIGKSILSDLQESKKTLPVWKAYQKARPKEKKLLKHILESKKCGYTQLEQARQIIKKTNSYGYCIKKIEDLLNKANQLLLKLKITPKNRNCLHGFIAQNLSLSLPCE